MQGLGMMLPDFTWTITPTLKPSPVWRQAEGGYVQGLGMMLSEDVKVDLTTGKLLSDSTWTYKVPSAGTRAQKTLNLNPVIGHACHNHTRMPALQCVCLPLTSSLHDCTIYTLFYEHDRKS